MDSRDEEEVMWPQDSLKQLQVIVKNDRNSIHLAIDLCKAKTNSVHENILEQVHTNYNRNDRNLQKYSDKLVAWRPPKKKLSIWCRSLLY